MNIVTLIKQVPDITEIKIDPKTSTLSGKGRGRHQLIQVKLANMAVNLEAGHLMAYKITHLIDKNIPCLNEAAMAKYFATESACSAADEATRIFDV